MPNYTEKFVYAEEKSSYFCWKYRKYGITASLYIQKWRVPDPVPATLDVSIRFREEFLSENMNTATIFKKFPDLKNESIVQNVHRVSDHTNTVRFDTSGNDRPITSIYIPKEMIGEKTNQNMIQIIIDWC
ncbi:hypothetical protein [Priestia koreensis]|uniref:hypothetical protein n=1 Tax=Priestia koreensis TaxID=284581 RepID=UPI00203AAFE1|nr:hypothetical protein [Priestia koreensis]MCM3006319.1 hypothetical protein [Priestia koreensis]